MIVSDVLLCKGQIMIAAQTIILESFGYVIRKKKTFRFTALIFSYHNF